MLLLFGASLKVDEPSVEQLSRKDPVQDEGLVDLPSSTSVATNSVDTSWRELFKTSRRFRDCRKETFLIVWKSV